MVHNDIHFDCIMFYEKLYNYGVFGLEKEAFIKT